MAFDSFQIPQALRPFWSLCVEEQFYLIWPLFLLVAYKLKVPRLAVIAIVALSVSSNYLNPSMRLFDLFLTWPRATNLLLGSLVAVFYTTHFRNLHRNKSVMATLFVCCIILCFMTFANLNLRLWQAFLCSQLFAFLLFLLATNVKQIKSMLSTNPVRSFGRRTYSMYLIHSAVLSLVHPFSGLVPNPLLHLTVQFFVSLFVICFAGYVIEGLIDRLTTPLRDRLRATETNSN